MTTHGRAIQHTPIFAHEKPRVFSHAVGEYAYLRGLSKEDAEGELMRLGMSVIMGNVYHNITSLSPRAATLLDDTTRVISDSISHILRDILPHYGEMFVRVLEKVDEGPTLGTVEVQPSEQVTATGAHGATVDMPDLGSTYTSGISSVSVTVPRNATRKE